MQSNRRITLIVFSMVSMLIIVIVSFVALGAKETSYDGVKKRAWLAAEIIKNGLTAHMVNGVMDSRDYFLDSMKDLHGVDDIWIVRSDSLSEQYGEPRENEKVRDAIDRKVLDEGREVIDPGIGLREQTVRITIPYIATTAGKLNCLNCHLAKEGDVLGAISLRFNVQDDAFFVIGSVLKIMLVSIVFMVLILLFISRRIKPFTSSFDRMSGALKKVHEGDYSVRVKPGQFREDREASQWLNEIIGKLETVLSEIERNLIAFVHNRSSNNGDKLLSAQDIIRELAGIYNFKKTIETDIDKDDVFYRLSQVMRDRMSLRQFVIYENDLVNGQRREICRSGEGFSPCCHVTDNVRERCRAERVNMVVLSDNFPEVCRIAKKCGANDGFICIPVAINSQKSVTLSIVCNDSTAIMEGKKKIGIIKKYFEEAKPILESKMLMEVLVERNFTDGLTGLYNRKYLDEFVAKKMPALVKGGMVFGIMMLDVDYFKMVNDSYGHDIGDAVLQKLSLIMRSSAEKGDHVIRFGGEEFLILVENATPEKMQRISKKINLDFAAASFKAKNEVFKKTISIGYSFFPTDTRQFYKCIKYADLCLYQAKEQGRNRIVRFTPEVLKDNKASY